MSALRSIAIRRGVYVMEQRTGSFEVFSVGAEMADMRRKVAKRRLESEPSYEALTRIKQKRHRQRPLLLPFQPR